MLEFDNVSKSFWTGTQRKVILDRASFRVELGESLGILAPNGTRTLATEFWAKSSEIDYAGAAPYALAMVLLSLPTTYLLFRQSRRAAGRTTRTRGAA